MTTFDELLAMCKDLDHGPYEVSCELPEGVTQVSEEFEEGGRWSNYRYYVFRVGDRFLQTCVEEGAAEMQQDSMGHQEATCVEVFPRLTLAVEYDPKPTVPPMPLHDYKDPEILNDVLNYLRLRRAEG